jgi:hypothetical protein
LEAREWRRSGSGRERYGLFTATIPAFGTDDTLCSMRRHAFVLPAVLLSVIIASAQEREASSGAHQKTSPTYRAESSAYVIEAQDAWTYVTENRSFRFEEVLGDGNYEAVILLEQTYHNERTDGLEGTRGTVRVNAWTLKQGKDRQLRWTLEASGNEGEVRDRFYRVVQWGCCDVPTTYSYYSILNARKLYISNSDLLELWFGEGPRNTRYVGFGYSVLDKQSQYPQLQYGTDKDVLQRFSVVSQTEYYEAPQIFISTGVNLEKSLNLIGEPMSFSIVLKYPNGVELRIPVEADAIHPEKAKLAKGYTLRLER